MLANAVGQALAKHISREILDLIFSCGLSEEFNGCVVEIVKHIPPLQETIRDRLLDVLSLTLSGNPYRPPGSPNSGQQMNQQAAKEYREAMLSRDGLSSEMTEANLISLALRMLGTFNFKGRSLSEFVRDCAIKYLEMDNSKVREAAALTACRIYTYDPIKNQFSANALGSVSFVIEKLLTVAITDSVPEIRRDLLNALGPELDPHLSQPENVRLLLTMKCLK
jgi:serine/threonine-protein kinase mTOR